MLSPITSHYREKYSASKKWRPIDYPQVDASILITANVPSAKKIIVHGPTEPDDGAIPSQFPISEDIQVS